MHLLSGSQTVVEAKIPTVISGGKSYSAAVSTRKEVKTDECQFPLTRVYSDHPLRTVQSSLRASGGPGSVSAGTQASSGKSGPVSADTRVPWESATGSKGSKGSADPPPPPPPPPPRTASKGSADPPKRPLRVQQVPQKPRPQRMTRHERGAHRLR